MFRHCTHCGNVITDEEFAKPHELAKPIEYDSGDSNTLCSNCENDEIVRTSGPGTPWDIYFDCPAGSESKE
jgi:hypothetical protein